METILQVPKFCIVSGAKSAKQVKVQFEPKVDLLVGFADDLQMSQWPHCLGVPHQHAQVFAERSFDPGEGDDLSLLAAHVPGPPVPEVQILNDPRIVRDDDDHQEPSDEESEPSDNSDLNDVYPQSDWRTVMIFALQRDAGMVRGRTSSQCCQRT